MIEGPIKMVFVSLASVAIFALLYLFTTKILNKKVPLLIVLFGLSLLPLVSMLRMGTYESGDLSLHSKFAISFFESLKEGNYLPVWEKYMLGGHGYPFFLFIYPLPYYFVSVFHVLGISFIGSFKILASLSFILSGIVMYLLVKEETKKSMAGFIAAVFYLYAPYHLIDLHFRFAIGEILAFLFLPLTFYFIKKINDQNFIFIFLSSLSFGALILSHQAIALITVGVLFFYTVLLFFEEKKLIILSFRILSIIGGIGLSAFFWLPSLIASRFTYNLDRDIYFSPFVDFLFSPSRFGLLYQGSNGELYFPVGYIHLLILIVTVILFVIPSFRKRFFSKEKTLLAFLISGFFVSFFMMLSISKPIWEISPLLDGFQFSFRLSLFCAFFSSFIAGVVLVKIKNKHILSFIICVTVLITILNWGNRRVIPEINDKVLKQSLLIDQPPVGLGSSIWADADKLRLSERNENLSLISGNAEILELPRTSTEHKYIIRVDAPGAKFTENTYYFPGWFIEINKEKKPVNNKSLKDGLIIFSLPEGLHHVKFILEAELYQKWGRLLSLVSVILLTLPLVAKKFFKTKKHFE